LAPNEAPVFPGVVAWFKYQFGNSESFFTFAAQNNLLNKNKGNEQL
jgi:hypothetical protein